MVENTIFVEKNSENYRVISQVASKPSVTKTASVQPSNVSVNQTEKVWKKNIIFQNTVVYWKLLKVII